MMCPIRSPLQFIQTTNEAEPKLRMVFGKEKVQSRRAAPGVAPFNQCKTVMSSFEMQMPADHPGPRAIWAFEFAIGRRQSNRGERLDCTQSGMG